MAQAVVQLTNLLQARRPTSAHVNAFLLDWHSDGRVFHYDGTIFCARAHL